MTLHAHRTPRLTALDTNVLARYYVQASQSDPSTQAQCDAARALIESGKPLFAAKTVVLELEWVLRGFYKLKTEQVHAVLSHLITMPHLHVEDAQAVRLACDGLLHGLDFADALHHASCRHCDELVTFDDKGFAKRATQLAYTPRVVVPTVMT